MIIKNIDSGRPFDWGQTSQKYAQYRDIYPKQLYDRLRELGVAADGTAWLDLGTGTGVLPQNLYNPNASITGVDISAEQIAYARENAERNHWNIHYLVAPAEETNLPDHSFDAITAAQCFGYFDREKMRTELQRLIKPDGIFIKIYLTYTLDDEIAKKSHLLIKQMNPDWTPGEAASRTMYDDLFGGRITEVYHCDIPFTRESWNGRMTACRGTLASMSKEQFENWEAEHIAMLNSYPEEFTVKHKLYITYFRME